MGRVHRLKSSGCMDSLLKDRERIAASDNNTGGKIHGVVQTLNGCNRLAAENEGVAHGFHAENSDAILGQDRQHFLFETVEVGVHYVERHLDGIEREAVPCGGGPHLQMNIWTLVACETDKTERRAERQQIELISGRTVPIVSAAHAPLTTSRTYST